MRTPTPCVTVVVALVLESTDLALISHTLWEQSESPVTAAATPNCCVCPEEQPRSSALAKFRDAFLIGSTLMQVGCGVSVTVNSGVPSLLTSTHNVFGVPPQGEGIALAGLVMKSGVLIVFSIASCAVLRASALACMLPTTLRLVLAVLKELTAKSVSSTSMMSAMTSVVPRCLRIVVMACPCGRTGWESAPGRCRCGAGSCPSAMCSTACRRPSGPGGRSCYRCNWATARCCAPGCGTAP